MAVENERPISAILQDTFNNLAAIMRSEVKLAKTELKTDATELLRVAPLFVIGGILGLFAVGYLLTAALLALALIIPAWAASLVIFVFTAIVGAALISAAKARLRTVNLKPEKTVQTMKENAEWMKSQTR
jgi:hypothetical protein